MIELSKDEQGIIEDGLKDDEEGKKLVTPHQNDVSSSSRNPLFESTEELQRQKIGHSMNAKSKQEELAMKRS